MGLRLLVTQQRAFLRLVRSSASAASAQTKQPEPSTADLSEEIKRCYSKLDLSFENTKEAFKSKTNADIIRALVVLRICGIEPIVKNNQKILAVLRATLGQNLFKKLLKSTFFELQLEPVVGRLKRFGVKSILDYSVESDLSSEDAVKSAKSAELEAKIAPANISTPYQREKCSLEIFPFRTYFYEGEEVCDRNRDIFMETVDAVAEATRGEGFAAIKVTALGRPTLLLKLSESIAQTHNFFKTLTGEQQIQFSRLGEENLVEKLKGLGVKADSKTIRNWFKSVDFDGDGYMDYHGWSKILDDQVKLGNMFQHAISKGVRVMIDAEQTYFQPAISKISLEMMKRYNRERGNIFNTYQAYLRHTLDVMECDMQLARREGWHFGLKLVRGAYMEQERKRAATIGYPDPVNPDFEATTRMYHACLKRIAEEHTRRGKGSVSVMIASHNEDTTRFAVNLMKDHGIAPSEKIMCFAQLYGMCDQVSFSLGQAGYSVYKYLPYGPVEKVLPYLSRRAIENGSIMKKANKERNLLWKELRRRVGSGEISHKIPMN
ncbi:unnamed protein product [Nippostrongylus brasiliensis]|uniref:Proline dehydrogenase n=1 Tax=Nippostrongylus brasiliensis TaxID=27835 RepID=A0A0N4XVT0_NIPBR|nr:unnamed protein product [Nippostrongylus brasiliensis]